LHGCDLGCLGGWNQFYFLFSCSRRHGSGTASGSSPFLWFSEEESGMTMPEHWSPRAARPISAVAEEIPVVDTRFDGNVRHKYR
jgi:hypothetical protein